ncbi:Oxo-4-hydroxy-4-carboxy-5-ureidoimidazoline decarboxylase [Crassisporium funariophilum]|nr:Oxo-4-hydroxy-4-carboxy-5-ureidoimidazoline decarboxylase [Crassisporium funariophilum]
MTGLPSLIEIQDSVSGADSALAVTLETLFEHSPILVNTLEPQLNAVLKSSPPISYAHLIDLALVQIANWDILAQSEFISGHPRIGERKNLSKLSANEQGAYGESLTPPQVLARLAHLNACYEAKYPGLRYITFVNGRSRAAIAEEMEDMLGVPRSLSADEPALNTIVPMDITSKDWRGELNRAVLDVGRIAESRLEALGANQAVK